MWNNTIISTIRPIANGKFNKSSNIYQKVQVEFLFNYAYDLNKFFVSFTDMVEAKRLKDLHSYFKHVSSNTPMFIVLHCVCNV